MRMRINLTDLIRQAAPQVFGGDERALLYAWLSRNADAEQIVEVDVAEYADPAPDNDTEEAVS